RIDDPKSRGIANPDGTREMNGGTKGSPSADERVALRKGSEQETKPHNPHVNIPSSRDKPESPVKGCNVIEQATRRHLDFSFRKSPQCVRTEEQSEKIECVGKLAASPQVKSDSRPPRILNQIIEMMFPRAAPSSFNFDPRLLSVESIEDTKYKSGKNSGPDAANREGRGRAASEDEASNRNLVWRDSRFTKN